MPFIGLYISEKAQNFSFADFLRTQHILINHNAILENGFIHQKGFIENFCYIDLCYR